MNVCMEQSVGSHLHMQLGCGVQVSNGRQPVQHVPVPVLMAVLVFDVVPTLHLQVLPLLQKPPGVPTLAQ